MPLFALSYFALLAAQPGPSSIEALLQQMYGSERPPVIVVSTAVDYPEFRRVAVDVCGYVTNGRGPAGESVLFANGDSLMVERRAEPLRPGTATCIRGVIHRRDGLTDEAAVAAGRQGGTIVHGVDPTWVLYRCSTRAECQELVRSGPPRR
jgi:hypothetical protein